MMPKAKDDTPDKLRPFLFHGVDLSWGNNDDNARGDCPWCGKEGKFSVLIPTGQWRCLVCGTGGEKGGGNIQSFIELLWEQSKDAMKTKEEYDELAEDRSLLRYQTLKSWGVAKSIITGNWLVPGFDVKGKIKTLYKRGKTCFPTPTLGHHIHGGNLYRKTKKTVYLCEGPWDGMALWEILGLAKLGRSGLEETKKTKLSLRNDASVLAVPGCETFLDCWLPLFRNKDVIMVYDSDHPREHSKTGKVIEPAGLKGVRRVSNMITTVASSVSYLKWGDGGYDPELPNGCDVRDYLTMELSNG